ncbi:MAG: ribose-phosphate pyrophosphokinase [Gammaproteobacteria bacterium]|nr:ribose-phosphate pyrophosphokinase [Gammaproteobacteria bacterium]
MKVFALNASRSGAAAAARRLGAGLGEHEEREFEDGEFKVRPLESVRGERVFVWHSLYGGGEGGSAADKLCRLLFFVGALKDAGAAEAVCVAPYLAFARKDRRTKPRDPVTTRYVALLFEAVGCDALVTVDVHNVAAFENAFRCPTLNLEAGPLLAAHYAADARAANRVVVLAPDAGAVKRARAFASVLQSESARPVELAFAEKSRSEGRVSGERFAGDVDGALVIVVDDLVSGGTTLARAAAAAKERGAAAVHAAITHGFFATGAAEALSRAELGSIAVTDTIGDVHARGAALGDRLAVVETAALIADALRRLDVGR